jgi:soluble calcium-activated nucleotidase 1
MKGFKIEWASVKDDLLYVGSIGKEWNNGESITNRNPQWVKVIDSQGRLQHLNWESNYEKLREATNSKFPGYMVHEAAQWNPLRKEWIFLPRRHSHEAYDEAADESRATNLMLTTDENFTKVKVTKLGVRPFYNSFHSSNQTFSAF